MGKLRDLHGLRFGKLLVVERDYSVNKGRPYWKCECDCGNTLSVLSGKLLSGNTKSCGCTRKSKLAERNKQSKIHGAKSDGKTERLYSIWCSMKRRFHSTDSEAYHYYGGKGIVVCKEWNDDYSAFKDWAISNGYKDNLTIDRIDSNGNYCPDNCRWATKMVQANNRTNNCTVEYNGEQLTIAQLARETGVPYRTIYYRLKANWGVQRAVEQPSRRKSGTQGNP